ncbi:ComEC/Rec2 family competence protein [Nitratifractor sp.]|uniref:ComEC/Rec2 family competence protein n=1 Tax=Nitratifractor sp. TaxID=2268144 RepID=UPI0025F31B43|nr:ComEC/Rec2 family competence protein [Nitratifractor sp.]
MSRAIEKVPLLEGRREWGLFWGIVLLLFSLHLAWEYRGYREFVSKPFFYTWGDVFKSIPKSSDRGKYRILKVRSEGGLVFYTRSYRKASLQGKRVRLQLFPSERIGFVDYLKGPYIPSRLKAVREDTGRLKQRLSAAISRQHSDPEAAAFYRAIFLAEPLPPALRQKVAELGVSHLVALSGFHLGILWGGIFLILLPIYRFFQRRFFPWRYDLIDLGTLSLLLLAGYLWLTGMPPSLLRSYVMLLLGWGAVLLGIELVSFSFLAIAGGILAVMEPALLFSLGFWLSMTGVFFIFLLLKYFGELPGWSITMIVIPVGIFWLMQPVTHALFPQLSLWQFASPLFSLLFILFYPLMLFLHWIGMGGMLDEVLSWLWALPGEGTGERMLPLWMLGVYGGVALGAIRYRPLFYALFLISGAAVFWLYRGA